MNGDKTVHTSGAASSHQSMILFRSIKKTFDPGQNINIGWFGAFIVFFIGSYTLFLFGKRVVFPDIAFDTIHYHFFLGKSGFESIPQMFKPSEFFPLGMHSLNPLLDTANYVAFELIGYRFGTLLSCIFLIGSFVLSIGIVSRVTQSQVSTFGAIFIIPALIVNEGLFQVATYYIDNHYTFLALSYVYILMGHETSESNKAFLFSLLSLGFVASLLITKLTNVIYMIPFFFGSIYLSFFKWKIFFKQGTAKQTGLLGILVFILPIVASTGWHFFEAYRFTGNPVFPYYNGIFKSIYYPSHSWHFNFGPQNVLERIIYPYLAFVDPVRLGEVKDLFPDTKILTTFVFAIVAAAALLLFKCQLNKKEITFLFITFGSFFLWQVLFGYSRYGIALEVMLGLLLVVLVNRLMALQFRHYVLVVAVPCFVLLFLQSIEIIKFNMKYDLAWRPRISYSDWKGRFLSPGMLQKFTTYDASLAEKLEYVDVIVQCVNPSSAYSQTFPELNDKPMLNFDKRLNRNMTLNKYYVSRRDLSAKLSIGKAELDSLSFAIVLNDTNPRHNSLKKCQEALSTERKQGRILDIDESFVVDNFVGDTNQNLIVMVGRYHAAKKN